MNRFEIRDILNQHKEHLRVLPTQAMNALLGIIDVVNADQKELATTIDNLAELANTKEQSVDVGNRASKNKAKSKRSKR